MAIRDLVRRTRDSVPVRQAVDVIPSFASIQAEMNRLFDHFYNGLQARLTDWDTRIPSMPAVNINENETSFRVEAELPGITPDQLNISVTDGTLTIKAEKKEEKESKDENCICCESSATSFYRQVALPETADTRKAEAAIKNGLLTVTVPKKAEAIQKPKKIEVKTAA